MKRTALAAACLTALLASLGALGLVRPARAQSGITVISAPAPDYVFGETLTFRLAARSDSPIVGVTLFFRTPDDQQTQSDGAQFTPGTEVNATYLLDLAERPLPPFAPVEYWWEIRNEAAEGLITRPQTFFYEDNRFAWRTLEEGRLTVHWYQGDTAFGRAAMDIAAEGLQRANRYIGAPLPQAIDIYIYASVADVRDALARVGREWADGHADPNLGVVIVAVTPNIEASFNLGNEIPHELTHLLVHQVTREHYVRVPNWLNEGLAVWSEARPGSDYALALDTAGQAGELHSLAGLCGPFPASRERAHLAYAQSASVVEYIRARFGAERLAGLLAAYGDGAACEAGVERALGLSLAELEADWLQDVIRPGADSPGAQLYPLVPWLILGGLVLLSGLLFLSLASGRAR